MAKYYKKISDENGNEFLLAVNITGHGAPTEDTEAEPGMCYLDEDSEHGDLYKCIGVLVTETRTVYRWKKLVGQEEVERLEKAIEGKADKAGWAVNKYIGTDENGSLVAKDAPASSATSWNELTDRPFYAYEAPVEVYKYTGYAGEESREENASLTKTKNVIVSIYNNMDAIYEDGQIVGLPEPIGVYEVQPYANEGQWTEFSVLLYGNGLMAYEYDKNVTCDGNTIKSQNTDLPFAIFTFSGYVNGSDTNYRICLIDESKLEGNFKEGFTVIVADRDNKQTVYQKIPDGYMPDDLNPNILLHKTSQSLTRTEQKQVRENINAAPGRMEIILEPDNAKGGIKFNHTYSEIAVFLKNNSESLSEVSPHYDVTVTYDGYDFYDGMRLFVRDGTRYESGEWIYELIFEGFNFKTNKKVTVILNNQNIVSYVDEQMCMLDGNGIVLDSTTEDSTKKFRITVDDSGTVSATEITE